MGAALPDPTCLTAQGFRADYYVEYFRASSKPPVPLHLLTLHSFVLCPPLLSFPPFRAPSLLSVLHSIPSFLLLSLCFLCTLPLSHLPFLSRPPRYPFFLSMEP